MQQLVVFTKCYVTLFFIVCQHNAQATKTSSSGYLCFAQSLAPFPFLLFATNCDTPGRVSPSRPPFPPTLVEPPHARAGFFPPSFSPFLPCLFPRPSRVKPGHAWVEPPPFSQTSSGRATARMGRVPRFFLSPALVEPNRGTPGWGFPPFPQPRQAEPRYAWIGFPPLPLLPPSLSRTVARLGGPSPYLPNAAKSNRGTPAWDSPPLPPTLAESNRGTLGWDFPLLPQTLSSRTAARLGGTPPLLQPLSGRTVARLGGMSPLSPNPIESNRGTLGWDFPLFPKTLSSRTAARLGGIFPLSPKPCRAKPWHAWMGFPPFPQTLSSRTAARLGGVSPSLPNLVESNHGTPGRSFLLFPQTLSSRTAARLGGVSPPLPKPCRVEPRHAWVGFPPLFPKPVEPNCGLPGQNFSPFSQTLSSRTVARLGGAPPYP